MITAKEAQELMALFVERMPVQKERDQYLNVPLVAWNLPFKNGIRKSQRTTDKPI